MTKPIGTWVDTGIKACANCFVEKSLDKFVFNTKGSPMWCKECTTNKQREYMRGYQASHLELADKKAKAHKLKKYNLTSEEFTYMVMEQGGVCAVCGLVPSALYVDHDHTTGTVRGLLCQKCNSGIGFLGDSLEGLEKAVSYLKRTDSKEII